MKKNFVAALLSLGIIITGCNNSKGENDVTQLSATEFQNKIASTPKAIIIDVRTPEEFGRGHIEHAVNYNVRDDNFSTTIEQLDKNADIFVYCLSGSRSDYAAESMKALGFKHIYTLSGGVMKWLAAGLKLSTETTTATSTKKEMTTEDFTNLLKTNKIVLIDFYADWCMPCKEMEPFLEELKTELQSSVLIVRINVDENKNFVTNMNVSELPTMQMYKQGKLQWQHVGYIDKESLKKVLR